jgi:hypothetical protein
MLAKHVRDALLPDVDVVRPLVKQERQARARQKVEGRVLVAGLEEVEVVQLAEALVDAAAKTAQGDDGHRGLRLADPGDGFGKVGGLLVWLVDDLGRLGLGEIEVLDGGLEGVEVANDGLKVGLRRVSEWSSMRYSKGVDLHICHGTKTARADG